MAVSHAIETALLAGPLTAPTVVVAMFQRLAYFQREYAVYERLAAAGAVVVIGFTDGQAHQVPPDCQVVVLDPGEALADEWTVIALGPAAGAFLVATDAHRFDPTEQTLEAGREFHGRWGYSRVQAGNELARLRAGLGARLDPAVGSTIDALLAAAMPTGATAASSAGTDGERWATSSLHRMVAKMQDARAGSRVLRAQLADAHAATTAHADAKIDAQSGLPTPGFLARWTGAGRATALPVGVAVFDVPELHRGAERHGTRAAYHAARRVAAALTEPLGPVDAAVRLSEREFALMVPGASARHLRSLVAAASEQLALASDGYPGVDLTATVACCVTLHRPLPLDDLHLALGAPDQPAATLGEDPITVTTTAVAADPVDEDEAPAGAHRPTAEPSATGDGGHQREPLPQRRVQATPTTEPATEHDVTAQDVTARDIAGGSTPGDSPSPHPRTHPESRHEPEQASRAGHRPLSAFRLVPSGRSESASGGDGSVFHPEPDTAWDRNGHAPPA